MSDEKQHIGSFIPRPDAYEGFEFESNSGERHIVHDLTKNPNDPASLPTASMLVYYSDGNFINRYEVTTPSRLTEAGEAKFEFTERHKRAMKVATKTITATIAVGTLIAYIRKRR